MQLKGLTGLFIWFFFFGASIILFSPTIFKPFLCDDYEVMYRIINERTFFLKDSFRPLSDITLYGCYLIGGLNTVVYNIVNLLIHTANCYFLYKFCMVSSLFNVHTSKFIAWSSSLLFLIYPFHTESIVWVVGLASNLSCFFGFLALLVSLSRIHQKWKYLLASLLYFIGLLSYETIFPLPLLVLIMLYHPQKPPKTYLPWITSFSITLIIHFIIRYYVSGVILDSYGRRLFERDAIEYILNIFKVLGRLYLPPSDNSLMLIFLFNLLFLFFLFITYKIVKYEKDKAWTFVKVSACLVVSCIIPIMFGVSTHTSEGDRLVYFSSFFLMIWLSLLVSLIKNSKVRYAVLISLSVYFLFFLMQSNIRWQKAGEITNYIVDKVKVERAKYASIGLVNIPDEFHGAFLFRNGFKEALLINNIDTTGIQILRVMTSFEARKLSGNIFALNRNGVRHIPPNTFISADSIISVVDPFTFDTATYRKHDFAILFYWNKRALIEISDPFIEEK